MAEGKARMEQVGVESIVRWGLLIKTWATGRSYFNSGPDQVKIEELPVPRTLEELKTQAARVGANICLPDHVRGLAVVQYSADTLVIRLPPKERIDAMEQVLSAGTPDNKYPFPAFYARFLDRELTADQRLEVHASRIGDYTISMCA